MRMNRIKLVALLIAVFVVGNVVCAQSQISNRSIALLIDSLETDSTNWQLAAKIGKLCREKSQSYKALKYSLKAYSLNPSDSIKRDIAYCLYQRGDYYNCIDTCHSLLYPDSLELNLIAHCYSKIGIQDSMIYYRTLLANHDIENQSNVAELCRALIGGKKSRTALSYLDRYRETDSTNVIINGIRAQALYYCGMPEESCVEYEKLLNAGHKSISYYVGYAMSLIQCKRFDEALNNFLLVDSVCDNPTVKLHLGMLELDKPEYAEKGLADLDMAIELLKPDSRMMYKIYFSKGDYYARNDLRKAIDYFNMALEFMPDDADTYYQLAYCYGYLRDVKKEHYYYSKFVEVASQDSSNTLVEIVKNRVARIESELFMKGERLE